MLIEIKNIKYVTKIIALVLLIFSRVTSANEPVYIEYYFSNNKNEINLQQAYKRLIGTQQNQLHNSIQHLMQINHIKNGEIEDILGAYHMSSSQNITADNSEIFRIASDQLSLDKALLLAKQIAVTLNQESVAVFIPAQKDKVGDIIVSFHAHEPTINEFISLVHEKLPASYEQAFTLHLNKKFSDFKDEKINSVEWLGSQSKIDEIKKAFPQESISYQHGSAYLVYKTGKIVKL